MRERLASEGGKRLDLYLTKEEAEALEAFKVRGGHSSLTDAAKALIAPLAEREGDTEQPNHKTHAAIAVGYQDSLVPVVDPEWMLKERTRQGAK
jgi:hypothetical protein